MKKAKTKGIKFVTVVFNEAWRSCSKKIDPRVNGRINNGTKLLGIRSVAFAILDTMKVIEYSSTRPSSSPVWDRAWIEGYTRSSDSEWGKA